jgi:hypothetical protein
MARFISSETERPVPPVGSETATNQGNKMDLNTPLSRQDRSRLWQRLFYAFSAPMFCALLLAFNPRSGRAEQGTPPPPGTKITMQNWQQYKDFLPDGLTHLFQGDLFWKLPQDAEIDIGPTVNIPIPPGYIEATEQYGGQTQVVHLPNGHMDVRGYVAGLPFPNPQEPDKGYKILVNAWYSYRPHLNVDITGMGNPVRDMTVDSHGNSSGLSTDLIYRQTGYNTDPGVPRWESDNVWYTEYIMVEAPEQAKYTAQLTLFYKDEQSFQDEYAFIPSLRRSLRLASTARCSPLLGTDFIQDDYQVSGFNGGLALFDAEDLGSKKIIALTGAYNYQYVGHNFPFQLYQPLNFPPPGAGAWQVRDVDVLDIRRIPSARPGYCYGKRIMYLDTFYHTTHWQDIYDSSLKLWKLALYAVPDAAKVPGVPGGLAPGLGGYASMWDIQNDHMTIATSFGEDGQSYFVNSDAPKDFQNYTRYSTPGGLTEIMR